jgi:hypothetical protein
LSSGSNVCYAYQKNQCRYGDSCRFDHVLESGGGGGGGGGGGYRDEGRPRRSNVCFEWRDGRCDRGDNCRFDHFEDRDGRGGGDRGGRGGDDRRGGGRGERRERGTKNKLRSGDWWCPVCQIHKFAFREDCEKCGSKKTEDAMAEVDKIIKNNEEAGLPDSFRPGDWMCPQCKDHIFAKHDTCNKCDNATMKPTDGSAWGVAVDPSSQSQPQSQGDGAAAATEDSAAAQDGSNTSAAAADEDEAAIVAEAA